MSRSHVVHLRREGGVHAGQVEAVRRLRRRNLVSVGLGRMKAHREQTNITGCLLNMTVFQGAPRSQNVGPEIKSRRMRHERAHERGRHHDEFGLVRIDRLQARTPSTPPRTLHATTFCTRCESTMQSVPYGRHEVLYNAAAGATSSLLQHPDISVLSLQLSLP